MDKIEDTSSRKRVIVYKEKGIFVSVDVDKGVEIELIDWDHIKCNSLIANDCGNGLQSLNFPHLTHEKIDNLQKWGKGLVSHDVIERLREYAVR